MSDVDDSELDEFEMVMPFVMCQSNGGPHDDASFVSGYRLGGLSMALRLAQAFPGMTLDPVVAHPNEQPQIDLLAMRFGFTLTVEPFDDDWATYTFERVTE